MPKKTEQIENLPIPAENIEQPLAKSGIEQHSLETSYVGLPGSEKLVAETATGQQVEVKPFDGAEIINSFKLIKGTEDNALKLSVGQPIEMKGQIAKQTMEKSKKQAQDLMTLGDLFHSAKNEILLVKPENARRLGIEVNFCAMVTGSKQDAVRTRLQEIGYTITPDDNGFKAEANGIKLYFMYGIEKHAKPKPETRETKAKNKPKNKTEKLAA